MPVGVWIADINGRIIETNEQANIIWGKPPNRPDSMTEYNKYRGWWPDTGKRLQAEDWAISRALTKGEVIVGEEVNIQRFGGSFGTILNNAAPIRNNEGQIIGGVIIEQDITRRKQEEYRISRYNNVLKGINRIFSSVVKAETEEDLGIACLSVALEITSSQIGFVGEISTDGLLHDIAISKMGWEQCLMHEKIGNIHFPEDLILHGLYGHVINSGKGFFTNNPSSHPDSIGLLQGHPLLTSFLGVPLF
ncbi:MAG TPA: GAF domain-containing protein [Methanosarcina sp.]|nr:GAF domain-containing protein [Methanosarcina sp.]